MDNVTRIGVDLAKNVIQLHGVDSAGRVVLKKSISRHKFLDYFANLPSCLVAMEACSASHYWARKLRALGHEARLIAPQFAAPYRKGGKPVKSAVPHGGRRRHQARADSVGDSGQGR